MAEKTFDPQSGKFVARIAENLPKTLTSKEMQYWINNPKKLQKVLKNCFGKEDKTIVSDKFDTTDFAISTTSSSNTFNIKKDVKKLLPTKEEGGLFDYRDSDIMNWFGDVDFTDTESVSGRVQLFKNNITHRDIIAEGENLGIYQEYELGHALLLANELVKAGAIEKKGYGVIIYLKNRKNDIRYHLNVWRSDGGDLYVFIIRVSLDYEWYAGYGVLFS